jgi:hypothetical protein
MNGEDVAFSASLLIFQKTGINPGENRQKKGVG